MDSEFDADWKEEVEDSVGGYSSLSEEAGDAFLDKEVEKGEIAKCVRKLKNNKYAAVVEQIDIVDSIVKELKENA